MALRVKNNERSYLEVDLQIVIEVNNVHSGVCQTCIQVWIIEVGRPTIIDWIVDCTTSKGDVFDSF